MRLRQLFVTLGAVLALGLSAAHAGTVTIDFEHTPGADGVLGTADDGAFAPFDLVRDQYAPLGLVFSQGTVMQSGFFDGNPDNHFLTSSVPLGSFTTAVYGIRIESFSFWDATLNAYDADGKLLASDRLANPTGDALRGTLGVSTATPIARFAVVADTDGHILNLDNLVLMTDAPSSHVPEPATPALFAAGLAVLAWRARRAR